MLIHQMAPWVPTFIQSCKNNTQPFVPFQFATVDKGTGRPRCRTVVFRDFLFKDKNSNILTFNTDLRSDKIEESFDLSTTTSYSGNTSFEACFYFPQSGEQYRFSGEAFLVRKDHSLSNCTLIPKYGILSPSVCGHHKAELYQHDPDAAQAINSDNDSDGTTSPAESNSSSSNNDMMTCNDDLWGKDYVAPSSKEWTMEIMRQWSHLSRSSKSQYRKPQPGMPVTSETSKQLDKIQRGVDGTKENNGLENFAIVCLCIDQVDYLNLKDGRGGERWKYKRIKNIDEDITNAYTNLGELWEEREVCP